MWVQCFAIKRCTFFGYKVMDPEEIGTWFASERC